MNSVRAALTLWEIGLADAPAIVAWADAELIKSEVPLQELIDLSLAGPGACLKRAEQDFSLRPIPLTYEEEFGLRGIFVDLSSYEEAVCFAEWASRRCIGEDLRAPAVRLGYELDHLLCDLGERAVAVEKLRTTLAPTVKSCASCAAELLQSVPGLMLNRKAQLQYT